MGITDLAERPEGQPPKSQGLPIPPDCDSVAVATCEDNRCILCYIDVPWQNDARAITAIVSQLGGSCQLIERPQHFLPIEDCQGTPELAQYIEGQPVTGQDDYLDELERFVRQAYQHLLNE